MRPLLRLLLRPLCWLGWHETSPLRLDLVHEAVSEDSTRRPVPCIPSYSIRIVNEQCPRCGTWLPPQPSVKRS